MNTPAMPELPEPFARAWRNKVTGAKGVYFEDPKPFGITSHPDYEWTNLYTEAQALATLQAQPAAAGVSDERLLEIGREWTKEVGWYEFEVNDFIGRARAILALRPQAVPMTDEQEALEEEEFSLLSQTQIAALLWVLWCHQGASSPVGQPIRFALGMDKRQAMSDEQVSAAQRFRIDWHQWSGITAPAGGEK